MSRRRTKNLDGAFEALFISLKSAPLWVGPVLAGALYLAYALVPVLVENPRSGSVSLFKAMTLALTIVVLGVWFMAMPFRIMDSLRLRRVRGLRDIQAMHWRELEWLVAEAYRRQGYTVRETPDGPDGGVDLILVKNGEKTLVQCKQWRKWSVGVRQVRELYGVMASEGASNGIVVSCGEYTHATCDFARNKPLELVNGERLTAMISAVQEGRVDSTFESNNAKQHFTTQAETPRCPLCNAPMILHTNKKGFNPGSRFWGCSTYPHCRGKRSYETPAP